MIRSLLFYSMTFPILAAAQQASPKEAYEQQVKKARADYRKAIAPTIRAAKEVELFLLQFDDVKTFDELVELGVSSRDRFPVAPYSSSVSILSARKLNPAQSQPLLNALANQIEKPIHSGGAFCHFPIHGMRLYSGGGTKDSMRGDEIYSATFCWKCNNFGFEYPDGTEWLETNDVLRDQFNILLPVPKSEIERFEKKYPSKAKVKHDDERK